MQSSSQTLNLPKHKGTEEVVKIHLARALSLRTFRRQEMQTYVNNLVRDKRPVMFIQMGELATSFFRTPEGWSLAGKSLFNIFAPLPSDLCSCLEHKINRLVLPWGMLHEEVVVKKATSITQILNRAKLLLSKTDGVLYIIPPMESPNTPLEQELLRNYGIFLAIRQLSYGESMRMHH